MAKVAGVLLAYPGLHIEVDGHTDNVGSTDSNQRLSDQRSSSVRDYLVQEGVAATALAAIGFGETQPIGPNDTPVGRQMNRRVEHRHARRDRGRSLVRPGLGGRRAVA